MKSSVKVSTKETGRGRGKEEKKREREREKEEYPHPKTTTTTTTNKHRKKKRKKQQQQQQQQQQRNNNSGQNTLSQIISKYMFSVFTVITLKSQLHPSICSDTRESALKKGIRRNSVGRNLEGRQLNL